MNYSLNSSVIPSQEGRRIDLTAGTGLRPLKTHAADEAKLTYAARRLGIEVKRLEGEAVSVRFPDADGDYRFESLRDAIVHQVATGA